MELILWHEPARVTHAQAAARARFVPHPRDLVSHPRDLVSHPRDLVSHPRDLVSHPRDFVPRRRDAAGPAGSDGSPEPPEPHPSISEISLEVADFIIGSDSASYLWLRLKDSAVPNIRYLAGKHRLVCFDPNWQAVLNPPLLRRSGAFELSFCVGHSIDDPAPEHFERAIRGLTPQNWFLVLEDGDDHYVQAALTADGYLLEVRDGSADKHLQTRVSSGERVIQAFVAQASGGSGWRDEFEWALWH